MKLKRRYSRNKWAYANGGWIQGESNNAQAWRENCPCVCWGCSVNVPAEYSHIDWWYYEGLPLFQLTAVGEVEKLMVPPPQSENLSHAGSQRADLRQQKQSVPGVVLELRWSCAGAVMSMLDEHPKAICSICVSCVKWFIHKVDSKNQKPKSIRQNKNSYINVLKSLLSAV